MTLSFLAMCSSKTFTPAQTVTACLTIQPSADGSIAGGFVSVIISESIDQFIVGNYYDVAVQNAGVRATVNPTGQ
jgi:hypothetical protein